MADIDYIHKLAEYLTSDYHAQRIREQTTDQSFYDGSFADKLAQDVRRIYKPSTGARMINKPAAHLITSNPQAFRLPRKIGEVESAGMVAKLANHILGQLKMQNPNPIPQQVKTNMKRGEAWIQLVLNEHWTSKNQDGMPVWFRIPDPMVIFASPKEYNGIPEEVIVSYERSVQDIQARWPDFKPQKDNKKVKWLEYWSAKERYFEADEIPILGPQKNILGFVPFVHAFSGFGDESPEMKPDLLAVGALRYLRDLLEEECAMASDIRSGVHRHVFKPIILKNTGGQEISKEQMQAIDLGPYEVNILPQGLDWVEPPNFMPPIEAFQHYANIKAEIRNVMSPIFEGGLVGGGSGRYRDLTKTDALAPYNSILKAAETSFSTAMGLVLRILYTVPNMMPITVRSTAIDKDTSIRKEEIVEKKDIGGYYDCEIKLRAEDPLAKDRDATLHAKYFLDGLIDAETCLVDGFGKTQAQAKEIINRVMKDSVTIKSPMFTQIIGLELAQATGMMEPMMRAMAMGSPAGGKSPRPSEVETAEGREMIDTTSLMERGVRERQGRGE